MRLKSGGLDFWSHSMVSSSFLASCWCHCNGFLMHCPTLDVSISTRMGNHFNAFFTFRTHFHANISTRRCIHFRAICVLSLFLAVPCIRPIMKSIVSLLSLLRIASRSFLHSENPTIPPLILSTDAGMFRSKDLDAGGLNKILKGILILN